MPKRRKPPSQSWRAFLANHVNELISIDFFTVPTATFRVLFVLVVLAHHRRRVLHFNVTEHPTALWTGQQIIEAFPEDTALRYLLRDRDKTYGEDLRRLVREYTQYYHEDRIHDALRKEAPTGRVVERRPTGTAKVVGVARVGGLHHRYHWQTAA